MNTIVQNCAFYGAKFDDSFLEVAGTIAEGLLVNAQALQSMAKIFEASNINIEAMVKVESENNKLG